MNNTVYYDTINNTIVKESTGNTFIINGISYIVGEKKIKKGNNKKVVKIT